MRWIPRLRGDGPACEASATFETSRHTRDVTAFASRAARRETLSLFVLDSAGTPSRDEMRSHGRLLKRGGAACMLSSNALCHTRERWNKRFAMVC
jgi:hypothetical protein